MGGVLKCILVAGKQKATETQYIELCTLKLLFTVPVAVDRIDLFPNQAKAYVFWNLYPCPHPSPPLRGREPFCGRFK